MRLKTILFLLVSSFALNASGDDKLVSSLVENISHNLTDREKSTINKEVLEELIREILPKAREIVHKYELSGISNSVEELIKLAKLCVLSITTITIMNIADSYILNKVCAFIFLRILVSESKVFNNIKFSKKGIALSLFIVFFVGFSYKILWRSMITGLASPVAPPGYHR